MSREKKFNKMCIRDRNRTPSPSSTAVWMLNTIRPPRIRSRTMPGNTIRKRCAISKVSPTATIASVSKKKNRHRTTTYLLSLIHI